MNKPFQQHKTATQASGKGLPVGIRALILAASYWVLSLSLTVNSGTIAAILGCICACYLVFVAAHSQQNNSFSQAIHNIYRLRIPGLILIGIAVVITGALLSSFITSSASLAEALSPITMFNIAEASKWFFACFAITFVLRCLAQRTQLGPLLEILFVATAFVITLSAHRNGMIHRPFFIGDFALVRGIDPATILMAIGCGAVVSMAALLLAENNTRRLPYHFLVLGLLCFSLIGYIRLFGMPTPQLTDDLGLTGTQGGGGQQQQENPFKDRENDTEDQEAPVAVVLFRDDYEPNNGSYYFRESAYSQFNGSMLDFAQREDMDQDLIENFSNTRVETQQAVPDLSMRKEVRTTIGLLAPHPTPFGLDSPSAYQHTPNPNNLRFKRTYDAYSLVPEYKFEDLVGRESGREDWSEEVLQEYLTLPDDPRYGELANELIADLKPEFANDPYAKAQIIKMYLDENGIYSLKNEHAYEADPPASFLFGDLTGYCMHFSFAATYMYRSIGIPARVGIGYSVPAENRAGGSSLLIQAIHGHAWPEIYLRGVGWVIVDPAPQQTLVDMTTDPQNSLQQLLGDMLRDEASFDEFLQSQSDGWIPIATLVRGLAYALLGLLLVAYLMKYYRLWAFTRLGSDDAEKLARLGYRACLDQLSSLGFRRQFGESREHFAQRLNKLAPSFASMTHWHLAVALGNNTQAAAGLSASDQPTTSEIKNWHQSYQQMSQELRGQLPKWRQILGQLNPISWLLSK